jgi:hypothetical protein
MKTSQILVVCLSLIVGYIAATALNRPSSAQPPPPQPAGHEPAVWRYQLTAPSGGAFGGVIILTDTASGRCWVRSGFQGANWEDLGTPVDRK